MILSCPSCPSRFRFDEARLPERGAPVRCKNCRTVFRAMPPRSGASESSGATEEVERPQRITRPEPARAASPASKPAASRPDAPAKSPARARAHSEREADPVAVPVRVVPSEASPLEADIRRLTRIIFSDIVIYGPEKADKAIRQGRFIEAYKTEIEEGRKMIRSRFPSDTAAALETFKHCLDELLEARKKELHSAVAL